MAKILITYDIEAGTNSLNESLHSSFKEALKKAGFQDYIDGFLTNDNSISKMQLPNTTIYHPNSGYESAYNLFKQVVQHKNVKLLRVIAVEFTNWIGQEN